MGDSGEWWVMALERAGGVGDKGDRAWQRERTEVRDMERDKQFLANRISNLL